MVLTEIRMLTAFCGCTQKCAAPEPDIAHPWIKMGTVRTCRPAIHRRSAGAIESGAVHASTEPDIVPATHGQRKLRVSSAHQGRRPPQTRHRGDGQAPRRYRATSPGPDADRPVAQHHIRWAADLFPGAALAQCRRSTGLSPDSAPGPCGRSEPAFVFGHLHSCNQITVVLVAVRLQIQLGGHVR